MVTERTIEVFAENNRGALIRLIEVVQTMPLREKVKIVSNRDLTETLEVLTSKFKEQVVTFSDLKRNVNGFELYLEKIKDLKDAQTDGGCCGVCGGH